jgi:hypothetical protein
MWFLIKAAFWFTVVLVLLPVFHSDEAAVPGAAKVTGVEQATSARSPADPAVDIGQTVSAASEALGYITAICSEKPDVCVKGSEALTALGHRARDGARIAYELLDAQFGGEQPVREAGDALMTGTVPAGLARNALQALPPKPAEGPALRTEPVADVLPGLGRIPVPEKRIEPQG